MKLQATEVFPLHDEGFVDRGEVTRGNVPKLLPHPDLFHFSKEVNCEVARLKRHGDVIRYDDYTFPLVKRGYAMRNHKLPIEKQQKLETLRSLYNGSWNCVPGLVERVESRILNS